MIKSLLLLLAILGTAWSGAWAQTTPVSTTYEAVPRPFVLPSPPDSPFYPADAARATTIRRHTRSTGYNWVTASNQWTPAPVSTSLTYTSQGQLLQVVSVDSATRVPVSRITYTYNSANLATTSLTENWVNSAWRNTMLLTWTYDSQGRMLNQIIQDWTNGAWVNSNLFQYLYDSQRQTGFYTQNWTNGAWATISGSQMTTVYDSQNRPTEDTQSNWNNSTKTYVLAFRYQYTYSDNTSLYSSYVQQNWVSNAWVNTSRFTAFRYDVQNRTTYYEMQVWSNNAWTPNIRTTTTYTANSNDYVAVTQNVVGTGWADYTRLTRTYDAAGGQLSNYTETWTNGAWQPTSGQRYLYAYNSNNDPSRRLQQRVDAVNHVFLNVYKLYYYDFQSFVLATRPSSLAAQTSLYPNPAARTATLQLSGLLQSGAVKVIVLNSLGQPVLQQAARAQAGALSLTVDLSSLPAGLYSVHVQTTEGSVVKRLVKE
ncbi:T9SS type A sorting domain-containing protein [Hymenobacter cellulosilyticus]|uniref:T9SS type A sorting domain-containing protein n=1 Tax=Hymenobacter cellulosilyticus TaxID=2932248 RepID=A0A8T9QAP7_9BACT|nr:T9SS type A sorting domain-containing protein [Hymenobacter cellulosilyticus]UOQ74235.1 T9SS type A sorting domain-containing protein [Hymenobacter cellulosilyticus]